MNKKVLILSGPTHEYLDPVRFIGNASSGLMGKALAEEGSKRGYTIEFVSGPVADGNLPAPLHDLTIHRVVSAEQMLEMTLHLAPSANVIIFAAAVADYAPAEKREQKMAKASTDLILHLRPTPDIAKTVCAEKRPEQIAIGFALQTEEGQTHARKKLDSKRLDGIVLNSPATLGAPSGTFSFLRRGVDSFDHWGLINKATCAKRIFDVIDPPAEK